MVAAKIHISQNIALVCTYNVMDKISVKKKILKEESSSCYCNYRTLKIKKNNIIYYTLKSDAAKISFLHKKLCKNYYRTCTIRKVFKNISTFVYI